MIFVCIPIILGISCYILGLEVTSMIHEKIEIHLKDSEFTANLFTYFLDNSPEIDPERKRPVVLI